MRTEASFGVGLSLPNSGRRYLRESTNVGNKLSMNNSLSIRRTIYSSVEYHYLEYHYLKELFNRILQVQNGDLIFGKKHSMALSVIVCGVGTVTTLRNLLQALA